jgi:hypothetical protein
VAVAGTTEPKGRMSKFHEKSLSKSLGRLLKDADMWQLLSSPSNSKNYTEI